jgi:hypothetical protein
MSPVKLPDASLAARIMNHWEPRILSRLKMSAKAEEEDERLSVERLEC